MGLMKHAMILDFIDINDGILFRSAIEILFSSGSAREAYFLVIITTSIDRSSCHCCCDKLEPGRASKDTKL
jgi:hypothetical protein